MSMDGKFAVIRISDNDRKIVKEFTGRKGFAAANELRDKLNESADKPIYFYVKGLLYV